MASAALPSLTTISELSILLQLLGLELLRILSPGIVFSMDFELVKQGGSGHIGTHGGGVGVRAMKARLKGCGGGA